ncbi:TPA: hypothetical protein N0F65_000240 [Lagenidium giganteum]|uniref:Splicing factor 3B subunit 1 n=1 Tax=Lagenidium giganteum TaxID=4803 RepID=A0AAV2YE66_9STRA|nr:TPA: hypothetical protein N0F65_000240 [Lagenidium giganteum]
MATGKEEKSVGLGALGGFDSDLYGDGGDKYAGYARAIPNDDDDEAEELASVRQGRGFASGRGAAPPSHDAGLIDDNHDPFASAREDNGSGLVNTRIVDRENDYRKRRFDRMLSPERSDVFDNKAPARSYKDIMQSQQIEAERAEVMRKIQKKRAEEEEQQQKKADAAAAPEAKRKRRRWDDEGAAAAKTDGESEWDTASDTSTATTASAAATPSRSSRWDATPAAADTGSRWDATPVASGTKKNRWDETPVQAPRSKWDATPAAMGGAAATPAPGGKRSRWDETPVAGGKADVQSVQMTPGGSIAADLMSGAITPEMAQRLRWEREIEERNRPLSDEELDAMFPATGYRILEPPASYVPIRTPSRKLLATPTPMGQTPGFAMQATPAREDYGIAPATPSSDGIPFIKPEDYQYFGKLMDEVDEEGLDSEAAKERKIMRLLLKIKNGTPPQRKTALRQITDKAREFGAGPLFNQILPLLMSPTLEDQERHLLVKVIDRVLYKLDDLVRPYVHKILVVIEPLLIDEDYYARVEGREIISNLAKAAGLAAMISTMRPDIDNTDEYVRNTTARAFAVVASALGIPALLPFLKAVCQSRKSWQARHTGIKIVQQIAILMGCAVLPHLKHLVEIIEHGLVDEQKVRTITALALAALAEAAHPYGIESFDSVLRPLWKGIRQHRGKGLAAFLKAIGFIIPLMDAHYANYYTREVMVILIREFQSPDEEMKKIVLKVVKQCVSTEGVEASYVKENILPEFFKHFWVRRMALDRRNYRQLVETTVELANNVGASEIISRVVDDLKDESEPYRRMVMEAIQKVISNLGASDVGPDLEERLIDGILYAFQEQTSDDTAVMLNGFGIVVNALGIRSKNYLPQICGTIKWRLNNKPAKVRMQAADLISRIAVVMKACDQEQLMGHMGVVLYEYLGEEYPEVLGSILGALKAIVNVIGMTKMTPPIKDLLPRLTPILKNRHEKVQENCIDLLLEMLKAHKKGIRRAAVNTFGYIAKAIGPQDVLHTLLNNLKVQERQNRVCTTVAIAIVAETCSPFTVVPALMNEYRVPELNVQNGVLKAFSFMFEYIGEMGKHYIYAVAPLLQDALMDRDLVHRQTACTTVKHLALGVAGLGCEDALTHLLNYVWPNIFETSPHVINAVFDAIEGCRVALGPHVILQYVLQGLFHPARRVREVYWKIYNSLYMYAQDGLTPAYPAIQDDGVNSALIAAVAVGCATLVSAMDDYTVPSFDYTQLDQHSKHILEALQQDGIISLKNIPNYKNSREGYLQHAAECAVKAHAVGADFLQHRKLQDGTNRYTISTESGRALAESGHETLKDCPDFLPIHREFSQLVEHAVTSLGKALDASLKIKIAGKDISARKLLTESVHLDHFHAYEAPDRRLAAESSAGSKKDEDKDLSLSMHLDNGLLIAMTAPEYFDVLDSGEVQCKNTRSEDAGLVIVTREGKTVRPLLEADELVLMMGSGITEWIKTTPHLHPVLHGMRYPSAVAYPDDANHKLVRAWGGKMFLLAPEHEMDNTGMTYGEYANHTARYLVAADGNSEFAAVACPPHRHLQASDRKCTVKTCKEKPGVNAADLSDPCQILCNHEGNDADCTKSCSCETTTAPGHVCWMLCVADLPKDKCAGEQKCNDGSTKADLAMTCAAGGGGAGSKAAGSKAGSKAAGSKATTTAPSTSGSSNKSPSSSPSSGSASKTPGASSTSPSTSSKAPASSTAGSAAGGKQTDDTAAASKAPAPSTSKAANKSPVPTPSTTSAAASMTAALPVAAVGAALVALVFQ